MKERTYLGWIDALKGIAICGIIMVHSGGAAALPSYLKNYAGSGSKCVELFFLVSAFLSFLSLDSLCEHHTKHITVSSLLSWWKARFLRLIPLYYIALAVYLIFNDGSNGWIGQDGKISVWNVLSHIFFVHDFVPHYSNSILGVEWYLGALAVFYVIVPFLYQYLYSAERLIAAFLVVNVGCAYLNAFGYNHMPQTEDMYIYASFFVTYWIFAQLPTLFLGMLLYKLVSGPALGQVRQKKMFSYVLLLFCGFMLAAQCYDKSLLYCTSIYTMFGLWFAGVMVSQSLHSCPVIDNAFFRQLGKYSYGIYLFHYLFLHWYDKYVPFTVGNEIADWMVKYVLVIAVSFAVAYLLNRFVDKPIYRLAMRKK